MSSTCRTSNAHVTNCQRLLDVRKTQHWAMRAPQQHHPVRFDQFWGFRSFLSIPSLSLTIALAAIQLEIDKQFKGYNFSHVWMKKEIPRTLNFVPSQEIVIQYDDEMTLKDCLNKIAIITPVDKHAVDMFTVCPRFLQLRMLRIITRGDPTF